MEDMRIIQAATPGSWSPFPVSPFFEEGIASSVRMEDFVRDTREQWSSGDVFVIDACLSWDGCTLSSFAGIRLLKILRLLGHRQHCILYSFLPLRTLLVLCPHAEILLSGGTTVLQLPCAIDEALCRSVAGRLCEEDVTVFFRAEATELLNNKRHSLANWWGMLRVWDILHDFCGVVEDPAPAALADVLRLDSGYQGMLMNHIRFQGPPPPFPTDEDLAKSLRKKMSGLKPLPGRNELKVVFVDDEADKGWSYLLQIILYGRERPELFFAPDIPKDGIDVDAFAGWIRENNPDLIILDMRLTSQDESARVSSLSGLLLLDKLVSGFVNRCPILVFTASDKRVVRDQVLNAGADAMWTKEGIDEGDSVPGEFYRSFSLNRFSELLEMIADLTEQDYRLLYGFLDAILQFEAWNAPYWWEQASWYPGDQIAHTPIDRMKVTAELKRIFFTHKRLLSSKRSEIKETLYEILLLRLGRMLEMFHPTWDEKLGHQGTLGQLVARSWPSTSKPYAYAERLVRERNDVVHFNPFSTDLGIGHVRYQKTLALFFEYLTMDTSRVRPPGTLVGDLYKSQNGNKTNYHLKSNAINGLFVEQSANRCKTILGGQTIVRGVVARVKWTDTTFNLDGLLISNGASEEWEQFWKAKYWIVRWNKDEVILYLRSIEPRKGTYFLVDLPQEELQPGKTLYFHASLSDNGIDRYFSLSNVTLQEPEEGDHTYWRLIVQKAFQKDTNSSIVFARRLEPPFQASFSAPPTCLETLKADKGASRILFLPKWEQVWKVEKPISPRTISSKVI